MRILIGTVVSTKMKNTCVVVVSRSKAHPKYKKKYQVSKKYYADTAGMTIKDGETVRILETRPLSKLKRWIVISEEKMTALKATANASIKMAN